MSIRNTNRPAEASLADTDHDAEPADPDRVDHEDRRSTRLAPRDRVDDLPDPFVECGCGACHDAADPLGDPKGPVTAAGVCQSPRPVTVERAREIYIRYQRSQYSSDNTSKFERHRGKVYPRILRVDQDFRALDSLTTVMITRRISPLDESGEWIPPLKLNEMLHGGE